MKLELLTRATIVDDSMRFAHESKKKLKLTKENDEESNKGLSQDKKQSELLEEQERDHSSIATTTQVF